MTLVLLEVVAQWFYHQAMKWGSLSLVKPFLSLTPITVLPTAYLLRGDVPSLESGLGVLMTCSGLWVLLSSRKQNAEKKVVEVNGPFIGPIACIIVTSLLWAVTTTLQKTGAQLAGVSFFGFCYTVGIVTLILAYHLVRGIPVKQIFQKDEMRILVPIGLFAGLSSGPDPKFLTQNLYNY
jgi:drug/metabolite transporter (DMT)-like permease